MLTLVENNKNIIIGDNDVLHLSESEIKSIEEHGVIWKYYYTESIFELLMLQDILESKLQSVKNRFKLYIPYLPFFESTPMLENSSYNARIMANILSSMQSTFNITIFDVENEQLLLGYYMSFTLCYHSFHLEKMLEANFDSDKDIIVFANEQSKRKYGYLLKSLNPKYTFEEIMEKGLQLKDHQLFVVGNHCGDGDNYVELLYDIYDNIDKQDDFLNKYLIVPHCSDNVLNSKILYRGMYDAIYTTDSICSLGDYMKKINVSNAMSFMKRGIDKSM